jgi:predicted dehydrogenase
MDPYRFAIIGAGWRTEFFLRIVAALPERFRLEGLVVRDPEKGRRVEAQWGHRTYRTVSDLLAAVSPEFLVGSVSYQANYEINRALLETGLPVLSETPPGATLEQMLDLWEAVTAGGSRFQVAEQFTRQPHHAARLAAVRLGRVGPVHKAYVSVCHGYHGASLIRHFLDVGFDEARIVGMSFTDRVLDPGGREGPPERAQVQAHAQQVALLDFGGGRQAVFDFVGVQYFSLIRNQRVAIRGEQGEVIDQNLYTQTENGEPLMLPFTRHVAGANGNLEGDYLKGIQLGGQWVYRNPTAPARLSDEEIAMADLLQGMGTYVRGGPEVYPLAQAMQDHYLGLMIREAVESGQPVMAAAQAWSGAG